MSLVPRRCYDEGFKLASAAQRAFREWTGGVTFATNENHLVDSHGDFDIEGLTEVGKT